MSLRLLLVLAVLVMSGFLSYASAVNSNSGSDAGVAAVQPTPSPSPTSLVTDVDFSCHFRGGKKGLVCLAIGEFCFEFSIDRAVAPRAEPPCGEGDNDPSEFRVVCNDGYTALDGAVGEIEGSGLTREFTITAVDQRPGAPNIIEGDIRLGQEEFESTFTREDGVRLSGACELRPERSLIGRLGDR